MLLEMGNRLVEKNVLNESNDVFFLYETEIMNNFLSEESETITTERISLDG